MSVLSGYKHKYTMHCFKQVSSLKYLRSSDVNLRNELIKRANITEMLAQSVKESRASADASADFRRVEKKIWGSYETDTDFTDSETEQLETKSESEGQKSEEESEHKKKIRKCKRNLFKKQ